MEHSHVVECVTLVSELLPDRPLPRHLPRGIHEPATGVFVLERGMNSNYSDANYIVLVSIYE